MTTVEFTSFFDVSIRKRREKNLSGKESIGKLGNACKDYCQGGPGDDIS